MKKSRLGDAMEAFDPAALERLHTAFSRDTATERRGDIMVRLPYDVRRSLKQLAIDRNTTVQRLMEEAIDLVLVQYGHPPMLEE